MAEDASTPLDVLLHEMRRHWREGRADEAVALAKAAAPYLHPRASAGRGSLMLGMLEDDELDALCDAELARAASADGAAE